MAFYRERILPHFLHRGMAAERHEKLRSATVASACGNVLEIGFGSGLNLRHFSSAVTNVTGIETNPGMRKYAVKMAHEYEFPVTLLDMDAQRLGFDDGEFDTVVSTWTMCSLVDLDQALGEALRVLKPGGQLLFIEHGLSPDPDVQKWQHRVTWFSRRIFDGCHANRKISDYVARAGFEIEKLENYYAPTMPRSGGYMYQGIARKTT